MVVLEVAVVLVGVVVVVVDDELQVPHIAGHKNLTIPEVTASSAQFSTSKVGPTPHSLSSRAPLQSCGT